MEKVVLTEKTAKVLEILKDNGGEMVAVNIAALDPEAFTSGFRSVSPILVNLEKKGYITKSAEKAKVTVINKDGNEEVRDHTQYAIADAGAELVYETK